MPVSRGVTLAELLVALVLLGLVGALLTRAGLQAERVARSHEERTRLHAGFDAAAGFLRAELADLGPGDLAQAAPESLRYRATRGVGTACQVRADEVRLLRASLRADRSPQPGRDSLWLSLVPDDPRRADSAGVILPIASSTNSSCAGAAALALGTVIDTLAHPLHALPAGIGARYFEVMQVRFYASLGTGWLGARSVSAGEVIQPLAGPFTLGASRFAGWDSTGAPTLSLPLVRSLGAVLAGTRGHWPAAAGAVAESTMVRVTPANLP
ncbi:MAG: prepilin-type N-terminal cleavage/methylation domain-containing protein [Gemmatimonadales bacterium]